ncbi:MAG: hypothetical protein R3D26_02295 [Cyanobacteriota/Melainabacteria group bacterium]
MNQIETLNLIGGIIGFSSGRRVLTPSVAYLPSAVIGLGLPVTSG